MKKITSLLAILILVSFNIPVYAKPHNDLSWLGFLKLPKNQEHKHQILSETKEPNIWKKWKTEKDKKLDWLPKSAQLKKTELNTKLQVPLITTVLKKSRRSKRK